MARSDQELKDDIRKYAKLIQDTMDELERREKNKSEVIETPEKDDGVFSAEEKFKILDGRQKRKLKKPSVL